MLRGDLTDLFGIEAVNLDARIVDRLDPHIRPSHQSLRAASWGERTRTERVRRAADEVVNARVGNQAAATDHDQVLGGLGHLAHEMRGDEHGATLRGQPLEEVANPLDALGVEPVDGLVEHHCVWIAEQSRGDAETLAHSEREAPDALARHVLQSDELDQLGHARSGDPVGLRQRQEVVLGGAPRVHGARLEQRPDLMKRRAKVSVRLSLTRVWPESGASRPKIRRIVVDLPEPLGPRKPVTTPGLTVNESSLTASVFP